MGIEGNKRIGTGGAERASVLPALDSVKSTRTPTPDSQPSFSPLKTFDGFVGRAGVGKALAQQRGNSVPVGEALPVLSQMLGKASRFDIAA